MGRSEGPTASAGVCPMVVPGTTATAEDVEGGAAIVFTTTEGDVNDLRARVERMSEMHNRHHEPGAPAGMHEAMMEHPNMHAAEARAEPVEGGARLVLTPPPGSGDLDALRAEVREHAELMDSGECPMMSTTGGAPMGGGHGAHGH